MNSLFQEFARDVLNIEPKTLPMPVMSSPFSAFLEENKQESKEDLKSLKQKQKHLKETMVTVQKELEATTKKIAKLKQH
jgi:hypothetical protein